MNKTRSDIIWYRIGKQQAHLPKEAQSKESLCGKVRIRKYHKALDNPPADICCKQCTKTWKESLKPPMKQRTWRG